MKSEPNHQEAAPPRHTYTDGNGWVCNLAAGTLKPAPEIGAGFFSATREDGTLVIIHRSQIRELRTP